MGPVDVPVHEATVRNGSGRLFVRVVGNGRPVFVVHGGPDFSHEYLRPDLDRLADQVRLVYYDQRGRGRSFDVDGSEEVTIESEVADLDAVRRSVVGVDPGAVLGHSWGGLLALEYAIRHPRNVSHLILMNTAPVSHSGAIVLRQELARLKTPEQERTMRQITSSPAYRNGELEADAAYYRIHFGAAFHRRDLLDGLVGRLRIGSSPEGIVRARGIEQKLYEQTWSGNYDLIPQLALLRIPTLVIHGEGDFVPLSIAEEIASAVSGAELVVLADCGHFAYLDQPDEVRRRVVDFLTTT